MDPKPEAVQVGGFTIAPDHPSIDGHFPGRPLVPGVVLLDRAFALIGAALGVGRPLRLGSVKFSAPVTPGQRIDVACRTAPDGARVSFDCRVEGVVVANGTASFAARSSAAE